jgi:serine/threonine protein kinase
VETLERVSHPAVVRSLRAELDGPRPHVVLEHLDGPRLSTLVRRYGALEPAQYLPLGIELASALHYFRRRGLVHLDVKPSNVVMGAPARLIDLSVARTAEEAAELDHAIGTDAYMAPEQRAPDGRLGPAADVFGLAATLRESVPRRTPRELAELLDAGLDPEPANRPTAAEFAGRLEPLVAALPTRMTLGRRM